MKHKVGDRIQNTDSNRGRNYGKEGVVTWVGDYAVGVRYDDSSVGSSDSPSSDYKIISKENNSMSKKYYRVSQDNFLWKKGAILENTADGDKGYRPLENAGDLWDATEHNGSEYISGRIIENNPDWFERVYPVNLLTKVVYKAKAEAQDMMAKEMTQ